MAPRRFSIGRALDCDVVLADPSVSRRHAEIELIAGDAITLVDCQSTHGTHVVDEGRARRIARAAVSPASLVRLGDLTLSVSDLLEAIQIKFPALSLAATLGPPAPPGPRSLPDAGGSRLVRCACGVIKPRGSTCPGCGQ